jgi:hypothetical protein
MKLSRIETVVLAGIVFLITGWGDACLTALLVDDFLSLEANPVMRAAMKVFGAWQGLILLKLIAFTPAFLLPFYVAVNKSSTQRQFNVSMIPIVLGCVMQTIAAASWVLYAFIS